MAQFMFAPMSDRVKRLLENVRTANHSRVIIDSERTKIFTDFYKANEAMPDCLKRAHCLYEWAAKRTLRVEDDDILVGNMGKRYRALSTYIEWDPSWLYEATHLDEEAFKARWQAPGCFAYITDEDLPIFREASEFWTGRSLTDRITASVPEDFFERKGDGCDDICTRGVLSNRPQGHYSSNFMKVVKEGFGSIKRQALEHIEELKGKLFDDAPEKLQYYRCTVIVCDAAILMSKRYAELCRAKAAETADEQRRAELLQMADSLDWIMENPCRNTWEAMQATLFYQMFMIAEGDQHGLTLGRVDQYAGWFAKKELEEGTITLQRLQDIADAFFIKLNDHIVVSGVGGGGDSLSAMYNKTGGEVKEKHNFGTNGQHFTVGGQLADGSDATNPMTVALLMAAGRMHFTDPSMSCRIHDGTPDNIWQLAIECSKVNGGVPTLENDNVIIKALMRRGISEVDARNYCIVGCVEPTVGGLEYAACGGNGKESFFNMVGCIIGAIHNGTNPATGYTLGPKTGYLYDYKTFEEFKEAYVTHLRYYMGYMVSLENIYEFMYGRYFTPVACSATMEGCMESGKDVMFGGAKYNSVGLTGCGIGNVADSLAAIKKLCFDEKSVSLREMYDALCAEWKGYETLRQRIITECPHYGNDNDYVDELCAWAMHQFCDVMSSMRNHRAPFAPSTFTMTVHLDFGKRTAATPDGRAMGDPLCDAISPRQGFDINGPTAYLASAAKLPHYKLSNGDQLNIRFSPSSVAGEEGDIKLRQMFETYFEMGGMQVQFNVVSTEMLHDAQKNPDDYENLVVRIAGFSAYFVEMSKGMQNDFISRTEQQM